MLTGSGALFVEHAGRPKRRRNFYPPSDGNAHRFASPQIHPVAFGEIHLHTPGTRVENRSHHKFGPIHELVAKVGIWIIGILQEWMPHYRMPGPRGFID